MNSGYAFAIAAILTIEPWEFVGMAGIVCSNYACVSRQNKNRRENLPEAERGDLVQIKRNKFYN